MADNNHLVIMAGGIGSRFWPMSTPECPKQFIDVMGCGKTMQLLQVAFNYEERGHKVCVIKPATDTKNGTKLLTRIGPERETDFCFDRQTNLYEKIAKDYQNVQCVLVDESQFLTPAQADQLMLVTIKLDIPVIALSQLSRASEARSDKRPMLSDLRESGAIEQDADGVFLLHRAGYYQEARPPVEDIEFILAKNRHGETGTIRLVWHGATGRIYEHTNREES